MATRAINFSQYADDLMALRYSHVNQGRKETWPDICKRVCSSVLSVRELPDSLYNAIYHAILDRKFLPGGRILSQAGRAYHQTDNCFLLRAENTREGWADLAYKTTMMFMSGGGVGCDYSGLSPYGTVLRSSGGVASGPIPLIKATNALAEAARQGGERRGANYASLHWEHPDVDEFISMKEDGLSLKHTNISVRFDQHWPQHDHGKVLGPDSVFLKTLRHACMYGDPGFQYDWDTQVLRNACTEVISADDCDSCCIGSVNLSKIRNLAELKEIVELGTVYLLCNTLYTDWPVAKVGGVKEKNRRLGLGLMGLAEWFVQRQQPYGYNNPADKRLYAEDHISNWLRSYQDESIYAAVHWAGVLDVAVPIAIRAIAPTGTISALGHTTPGIEPIFHTAYQRTYNTLKTQDHADGFIKVKVIDPIVMKWIEQGYNIDDIDTAYTLSQSSEGIERRLAFQAFVQQYVDNGISSTVNLPPYQEGMEIQLAPILLKYLPQLRGVTFYPDGRYSDQPVVPLDIHEVLADNDSVMGQYESCKLDGGCGS